MADRFRNLVAGPRDLVAAVDQSGAITSVGPTVQPTLGLGAAELVGQVLWEVVHVADAPLLHQALADAFAGEARSFEFRMPDADGVWRQLYATLERSGEDGPSDAILTAEDVTEQRRTEAELREHDEQLRQAQKMEVVGRLAGGITHDFGNLLTIIIGASGHMLDALPAGSPLRAHARSIETAAGRAASMVRQLLAFSRQRSDALSTVDLTQVVGDGTLLLPRLLGEHITLDTDCAKDAWPVTADRTQIDQVLLNLAVNARDAMPSGGRLTIAVRNVPAGEPAAYGVVEGSDSVAVSVTDTGIGMDEATRAHAFEPFFTTKALGKGTGLGLATVHSIVKRCGGWTHLESKPGLGTTVTFGLPRATDVAVASPSSPSPDPPTKPLDETVLIVEDQVGVRELVRDMLQMAGYRVIDAATPLQAERASLAFDGPIHLLLTDVVMPEMSGLDLSVRLRSQRPGLRVMYMSGYPEPIIGGGGADVPGAHFIAKPFDRQALLRGVRKALDAPVVV